MILVRESETSRLILIVAEREGEGGAVGWLAGVAIRGRSGGCLGVGCCHHG